MTDRLRFICSAFGRVQRGVAVFVLTRHCAVVIMTRFARNDSLPLTNAEQLVTFMILPAAIMDKGAADHDNHSDFPSMTQFSYALATGETPGQTIVSQPRLTCRQSNILNVVLILKYASLPTCFHGAMQKKGPGVLTRLNPHFPQNLFNV